MSSSETPLRYNLFTREMVDTRTAQQKRLDKEHTASLPKQIEMFSQHEVLTGEAAPVERHILQPDEILSPEAWYALCYLMKENLDRRYGTWHELHNFFWKGEHRSLIEPTPGTTSYQPRRSAFGEVYHATFATFYQGQFQTIAAPL